MNAIIGNRPEGLLTTANISLPEAATENDRARLDGYLLAVNKHKDLLNEIWKITPGWMPSLVFEG